MNIRIEGPKSAINGIPYAGHGTRIYVDGHEVHEVADIKAEWPIDAAVRVYIAVNATEALNFEGDADLFVTVTVPFGYAVVASPLPGGGFRYSCQRFMQ